jgi:hypothetical protein
MALRAPERIEAPAVAPALGGLLGVASITESGDRVMNGVTYFSFLCGKAGIAPGLCDVAPGVTFDQEKLFTGGEVVEGQPFPVYAGVICDLLGGGYEEAARARLAGGEERAVGRAFYEVSFAGGFPTGDAFAGTIATEDELLAAIGELEQYAGENYAGLPVLHMNRATAARALKWDLIDNDSIDGTLHTKQGTPVANSPGYPDGIVWITGAVHLWRTSVQAYDVNDVMNNQALSLAERVYTVATDCILAWAGEEPPVDTAPVLTDLDPDSIRTGVATTVTVSGTGFTADTKFYVDGEEIAAVVDAGAGTAQVVIPAPTGADTLVITASNGGAQSNALSLAVVVPVAPVLTSVDPTIYPRVAGTQWDTVLTGVFAPWDAVTTPSTFVETSRTATTITGHWTTTANVSQNFDVTGPGGISALATQTGANYPVVSATYTPTTAPTGSTVYVSWQGVSADPATDVVLVDGEQYTLRVVGSRTGFDYTFTEPEGSTVTFKLLRYGLLESANSGSVLVGPAALAPVITSISPNPGYANETMNSVQAANLATVAGLTRFYIDGVEFPITSYGASFARVAVPAGTLSVGDHQVVLSNGPGLDSAPFTWPVGLRPSLTSISPTSVTRPGPWTITATGTFPTGTIMHAGNPNIPYAQVSATGTEIVYTVPDRAPASQVAQYAAVPPQNATSTSRPLTILENPVPTLTSISPNPGPRGQGWEYTLTGTNFTATGTTVSVNGQSPAVTYVSPTQITVTANITAGVGEFTVTTAAGTSAMVEITTEALPNFAPAATDPPTVPPDTETSVVFITSNVGDGSNIVARETDATGDTIIGDLPVTATTGSTITVTIPARPADSTVYVRPYRTTLPAGAQTDPAVPPKAIAVVAPAEEP